MAKVISPNFGLSALLISCAAFAPASFAADPGIPAGVSKGSDPASKLVNTWFAEGKAAGLDGIFYDNRDRKHSNLGIATYPQLKPITYSEEELTRRADWGGQRKILPGKIVIGNSSTASPANQAGSHQRMYYTHPRGLLFLYEQYRSNALYIYPEHRDHDPGTNGPDGYGDLYPANSPYVISSQGSSGSDRVFMNAFLKTAAAFPPETREELVAEGLLMPTLQSIFRHTYKASAKPGDYFSGKAHPSAFDGKLIDEVAMVKLAHGMSHENIPPLVVLRVLEEPDLKPGRDFFEPGMLASEKLADSPCAIARVIRGPSVDRTIRISAKAITGTKERKLKFHWKILRGNSEWVKIEPAGEGGAEATITVSYHPRRPISPGSVMWSNRVDIGVFAEAEDCLVSAPSFVSFTTLPNEHRTFSPEGRLLEIFYGARSRALGMPPANSKRWDHLLEIFDIPEAGRSPGFRLITGNLEKEQIDKLAALATFTNAARAELADAAKELGTITDAQQKTVDTTNQARIKAVAADKKLGSVDSKAALDAANAKHNAAKKIMRDGADGAAELKAKIADRRSIIATRIRATGAPEIIRSTLLSLRSDPHLFSKNETAIRTSAASSPGAKATHFLDAALRRLAFTGVKESDDPPPNERYHLEQLNTDILSGVLLPDFLNRPPGENYADPRLTAKKRWRDVSRYKADGTPAGWTRFQNGTQQEFNAAGEMIVSKNPDGSPEKTVTVRYGINPKSKSLEAIPLE